jgi:hypothetical protein
VAGDWRKERDRTKAKCRFIHPGGLRRAAFTDNYICFAWATFVASFLIPQRGHPFSHWGLLAAQHLRVENACGFMRGWHGGSDHGRIEQM